MDGGRGAVRGRTDRCVCVAVTAAGSGIGQTAIDGLRACPFPVRVVGFERTGYAKGLFDCDVAHQLPGPDDPEYTEKLVLLCQREGVELLIPGSDVELPRIAQSLAELRRVGCEALCAPADSIRVLQDKKALHDFFVERGAPFFPTRLGCEVVADPDRLTYPAIAKPRWGSGSVGIQILATPLDWDQLASRRSASELEALVVQPLGRPAEWDDATWEAILRERRLVRQDQLAAQLFFAEDGEVIGRMTWLVRLKHGVVMGIEIVEEPGIRRAVESVEQAARDLGIRGPLNMQGIAAGNRTSFFEVNPRFSGSTGVRALLGYREVEAAVRHFALGESGEDVRHLLGPARRWIGLRQMSERVVPSSWVRRFEADGHLCLPISLERIVVTGASGYLGQRVVRTLLESEPEAEIVLPVRDPDRAEQLWERCPGHERLHVLPWQDLEGLSLDLMGEVMIHLAAVRPPVADDASTVFVESLELTRLAVHAARKLSIPLFVLASSHAVYEGVQPPWTEQTPIRPQSPYAYAKAACEQLVCQLPDHGTRYAILRMASLYGLSGRMQWERVAHRFAEKAAKGLPLELHGEGLQTIDLVHVSDAARAVSCLLQAPDRAWNRIYNITSNKPVSIAELAELCRRTASNELGVAPPIEYLNTPARSSPSGSCTRSAEELIAWTPNVSLEAGLREVMDHVGKRGEP